VCPYVNFVNVGPKNILGIFEISVYVGVLRDDEAGGPAGSARHLKVYEIFQITPATTGSLRACHATPFDKNYLNPALKIQTERQCPFRSHGSETFTARTCYPVIVSVLLHV
jgi:hypothetical protein